MRPPPAKPKAVDALPGPLPPAGVVRTAWSTRLDVSTQRTLTLVGGPPGCGKTTALAAWRRGLDPRRAAAWLRVDGRHVSAERWCRALLEAVEKAAPGAVRATPPPPDSGEPGEVYRRAEWLLGAIAPPPQGGLVIVIDGVDALPSPGLPALLAVLVADSPPWLRWVFAGRRADVIDTTALLLQGMLGSLDAETLRMDAAAVQQLARGLGQPTLPKGVAEEIVQRSEGWAAGVKFALLRRDEAGGVEALRGDRVDLAAYFTSTVLRHLSDAERSFVVATSLLEAMSGELCDALLGAPGGQAMLEALHARQCFVVPLDGHGRSYRYHRLFREFLQARLGVDPARQRLLHERASRWFAAQRRPDEALAHAFASGDDAWCGELLAREAAGLRHRGDLAPLVAWCERLPRSAVVGCAAIALPWIFALIALGRFEPARSAMAEARASGAVGAAQLDLLGLFLAGLADSDRPFDPAALDHHAASALDDFGRALSELVRAWAMLRRNRFAEAWRAAMRASEGFEGSSVFGVGQAQVIAVLAERARCDFRASKKRCEQLYAQASQGPRNAVWVNAAVVLAQLRYDENRIGESEALCAEVLPLLDRGAALDHRAALCITQARLHALHDRQGEAWALLELLQSRLEGRPHRRFLAQVCAEKIRLSLLFGMASRAHEVACEFDLPAQFAAGAWREPRAYEEGWERFGTALATLLVHDGDCEAGRALLTVLRDSAHAAGNAYRAMLLDAALGAVEWKSGHADAAFRALDRALGRSHGMGFLRTAFDDVPTLGALLGAAVGQRRLNEPLPSRRLRRLDSMISTTPQRPAPSAPRRRAEPQPEPLTRREIDMLHLIAKGMSNPQIGHEHRIKVSTVKWHVKNLYAKLEVTSRVMALAKARERRLIEP